MDKLLPCPFCGGEATISDGGYSGEKFLVRCRDLSCPAASGFIRKTHDEAIAAWNRRADAVPVVHGEWKLYGNDDDSGMSYWCTACNFQLSEDLFYSGYKNGRWIENGVFKYCPNCGAKMDKEDKHV